MGSILQLVLSLLLVHFAGAAVLGRFLAFVAISNILMAVAGGLPLLMMRYASHPAESEAARRIGWLWRHSFELAALGLIVSGVCASLGLALPRDVAIAAAGLALQRTSSGAVKAIGRPNLGVLLDTALAPLVVTGFVLWAQAAGEISEGGLRASFITGLWVAAAIAMALTWKKHCSPRTSWLAPRRTPLPVYREIVGVALGAAATLVASNAPLTLAPLFLTDEATGNLGIALRVAGFATTILTSLIAYFGPAFARASSAEELRRLLRQSQVSSLLLYAPIPVLALVLPSSWLIALSPELASVKELIVILCAGYLVNAATGLSANLLVMLGLSRLFAATTVVTAVLTVVSVVTGAGLGGALGLAVGLATVMSLTNLWMLAVARRAIHRVPSEGRTEEAVPAAAG